MFLHLKPCYQINSNSIRLSPLFNPILAHIRIQWTLLYATLPFFFALVLEHQNWMEKLLWAGNLYFFYELFLGSISCALHICCSPRNRQRKWGSAVSFLFIFRLLSSKQAEYLNLLYEVIKEREQPRTKKIHGWISHLEKVCWLEFNSSAQNESTQEGTAKDFLV